MKNLSIYAFLFLLLNSCSTGRLPELKEDVRLSKVGRLPDNGHTANKKASPVIITEKTGTEKIIVPAETDAAGEDIIKVDLDEVTITARSVNVPEINGMISIDFIVTIPESLLSRDWQMVLYPQMHKTDNVLALKPIVLNGTNFRQHQSKGYRKFEKYQSGILTENIDSPVFFDETGFQASTYRKQAIYSRTISNDRLEKDVITERDILKKNRIQKRNNRLDQRYNNILTWYESLGRDTTGLYKSFLGRKKDFIAIENSYRDLSVIYPDSLEFYKYGLIYKNEKKKDRIFDKYHQYIKFPYITEAILDSIVSNSHEIKYHYSQLVAADENSSRLTLTLPGEINLWDGRQLRISNSDTLTYFVSSTLNFIDYSPRYVKEIVERLAFEKIRAYIQFPVGKTKVQEDLKNNSQEINLIRHTISRLANSDEFVLDSIILIASCSPEGSFQSNERLSRLRAIELKEYFLKDIEHNNLPDILYTQWIAEDWNRLYSLMEKDSLLTNPDLLKTIRSIHDPDSREGILRSRFPHEYTYIRDNLYPQLRSVDFVFNLHKKGMIKDTIHTTIPDIIYKTGIELLEKRQFSKALSILDEYKDFNTAICLMNLGYTQEAIDILIREPISANREYLLAILYSRQENENMAIQYFLNSCQLDPGKRNRGNLDPEIHQLIQLYKLDKEI